MAENSGQIVVASSPRDTIIDVKSLEKPEEVNKQRRQYDWIQMRATLKAQECSKLLNAKLVVKDSRRSKISNYGNILKNVEVLSQRMNLCVLHLKGFKIPYVHDDRRYGTHSIQNEKLNNVKRLKHRDPTIHGSNP